MPDVKGDNLPYRARSEKLDRVEMLLADVTEKVHFLMDREMEREGGPESRR